MRKRLSVVTAAMIFACAISPVAVWAEEPATTETTTTTEETTEETSEETTENDIETLDLDEQYAPAVYGAPPTPTTTVATVGEQSYDSLQAAIDATNGQDIVLQSDVALTTGLKFSGTADAPIDQWKNFIIDANGKKLTLTGLGMHAKFCNVTIKNCPELTISASKNPGENEGGTANLFAHANLTFDACDKVLIQNDEVNVCGSGLYINERGSLYVQNKTNLTVTGYMGDDNTDASGIYADTANEADDYLVGDLVVSGGSTLTATKCLHNGITVNPMNITVTGNSLLNVNNNNDDWYGEGGLGCYYGKLTILDHSHVTAYKNTAWGFAIFVKDLEVDGTSEIDAVDNGSYWIYPSGDLTWAGNGISIAGNVVLHNGAKMSASGNWGPGVSTHIDVNRGFMGGSLTVENGATLTSTKNYNYGLANGKTLNINTGAHVYLSENYYGGLDNYPAATTTVDEKADLVITNNYGAGINNGNNTTTDADGRPFTANAANVATLILKSGTITENHANTEMPSPIPQLPKLNAWADYGAGICNRYGNVDISIDTKIYNNHADTAGDDLYNYKNDGAAVSNNFKVTVVPGAKWQVLSYDGKIIDDWYHDDEGEENRWKATNARNNTDTVLPLGAALKAAHGINAPTPSPTPATPKPAEPTVAPTVAPTAAPADNTATAAPATPAPTARPAVTATPAPTTQASGVIPQTGDSSSPALFSILTLGSITALCVLQKRRKSK